MKPLASALLALVATLRIAGGDGAVVGPARAELAETWATNAAYAYRHERAWCGAWYPRPTGEPVVYLLLPPSHLRWSTPLGVDFDCGNGLLPMHEHTGARCNPTITDCRFPAEPIACQPSSADLTMSSDVGWAAVVCGPDDVVFYRPHDGAGDAVAHPVGGRGQ